MPDPISPDEAKRRKEAQEQVREEYGSFFEAVLEILFRYDLMGIAYPANPHSAAEYEPEAGTIVPRIIEARSRDDVAQIVDEEFTRWFFQPSPAHISYYVQVQSISEEIWDAWHRYKPCRSGTP
jgi:hypothetical protein